ncbi:protein phosphatase 1 regulatory subunit 21 [Schistocerca gregaria]|uniref:protein phosphatase 1 regulatory subunit 21 n=1 Tax=Schistocerca gregaria TaxID=7010 RepID=UPI00211F2302|nr:protein phosphatase 1 regulatory subunit 21 [Schistocerca gregaria]
MEGVAGDLQTKYTKVAAEYSKLRAQAAVLKKAVLEEQTRNAELRDIIKEKEQSLRKVDQEMDSLTFRNQQLTKRVTVLQDELDSLQSRVKKGKLKSSETEKPLDHDNHVIDEEFQLKIEENARLVSMLHDKDEAHQRDVSELRSKLDALEAELKQHHEVNTDAEHKYKAVIESLEGEKAALNRGVEAQGKALEQTTAELCELRQHSQSLERRLQHSQDIISNCLPFIDSTNSELNELNVPTHDRKRHIYIQHVISQAGLHVRELCSALSDFHTYTEQRLQASHEKLSPVNSKLSSHLRNNAHYLRAIEQGYREFQASLEMEPLVSLETLPCLGKLSTHLSAYTSYLQKLQPYLKLSLEEDTLNPSCSEAVQVCSREVFRYTTAFVINFIKLATYLQLLSSQNKRSCQHPPSSQRRFLLEVTEILKNVHESIKELSRAYASKTQVERELCPSITDRLKTTDECLAASLTAMVAASGKLSGVLSDSRTELWKGMALSPASAFSLHAKMHPAVSAFKRRAASYMNYLDQDDIPTVPYEEALLEREQSRSSIESGESLKEQLASVTQRATQLEQDREHWKLEFQLLQLKHSKKVRDLEGQLQSISGSTSPRSEETLELSSDTAAPQGPTPVTINNLLGRLEAPFSLTAEAEAREAEVKQYFTQRINELVAETQEARSMGATFASECRALQRRLEHCVTGRKEAEAALQESQESLARLQEELHTTTRNYEMQLSIMSEHLANMNECLAVQRDEIDQLKFQLGQQSAKLGRKGKQK